MVDSLLSVWLPLFYLGDPGLHCLPKECHIALHLRFLEYFPVLMRHSSQCSLSILDVPTLNPTKLYTPSITLSEFDLPSNSSPDVVLYHKYSQGFHIPTSPSTGSE